MRADAASFTSVGDEHLVFTIQLNSTCGASVVASDYSAPSSPRSSVADDRDLETEVAPGAQVCPQLRKVGKKLAQIEQLKAKQATGVDLDEQQLTKLAQEADLRAQKSLLERQAALAAKQARAVELLGGTSRVHATDKTRAANGCKQRRCRSGARSAQPAARSADGRALPRKQRFSLRTFVEKEQNRLAASYIEDIAKVDAITQLDRKVAAVREADAKRQGWRTVAKRK